MASNPDTVRYPAPVRWLHWIVFGAVALAYLFINLVGLYPRGSDGRAAMMSGHFVAGLAVLLLLLPRAGVRLSFRSRMAAGATGWAARLAGLTHLALYAFLLLQPLLGLATLQFEGRPVRLAGRVLLPAFVATPDRAFAHRLEDFHGELGEIFYWVIGLHIAAALWHHFVRRDGVLRRML